MPVWSGWVHLAAVGSDSASNVPIIAAAITATGTIIAALVSRGGHGSHPGPAGMHNGLAAPDPGRRSGRSLFILISGAALSALVFLLLPVLQDVTLTKHSGEAGAAPTGGSTLTMPPPTSSPTLTRSVSLTDEAQAFVSDYFASYRAEPTADTLNKFWQFPLDWYNAKNVPDAPTLLHEYLNDGKILSPPAGCKVNDRRVMAVEEHDGYYKLRVDRSWKLSGDKEGVLTTFYDARREDVGKPFRLLRVYEEEDAPYCK